MKQFITKGLIISASLLLAACAYKANSYPKHDLTHEAWPSNVQTNPDAWVQHASRWFLTADPSLIEETNMTAPAKAAISAMVVRVSEFNKINVNGNFHVQVFGSEEKNSVHIYGPHEEVRHVVVNVRGDTLWLYADQENACGFKNVIIRVGVVNLAKLENNGSGQVEARQLKSTNLDVVVNGSGRMYLAGKFNLKSIIQAGSGELSIFGATSSSLDVKTSHTGRLNISGDVNLNTINHSGANDINIVGARASNLVIHAEGEGRIAINGNINIHELIANDKVEVYAYCVKSNATSISANDRSKVGLSGKTKELHAEIANRAQFFGRDLIVEDAFVRVSESAHANIMARHKMYAAADGRASIYFFGSLSLLSPYSTESGTIIPVWFDRYRYNDVCSGVGTNYNRFYYKEDKLRDHAVRKQHSK